jgi:predicted O-methyltransferase YrrM
VSTVPASSFEQAFGRAAGIEGWLTEAQARRLWDCARRVPTGGRIVEIGSFRGRSTVVMATALDEGATLIAIDPHAGGDRGPQEIAPQAERGDADYQAFHANLERAGVADRVEHVRMPSTERYALRGPADLLYVDGAHRLGPARHDLTHWGGQVREGGTMLVHDSFSSIGVTLATLSALTFGSRWRYVGRTGSLAEYVREAMGSTTRARNVARQLGELPWFGWNVALKVLIAARVLRRPWPY